uniref:Uncharacterized protein n=1 Tax=Oryza meridionalis TaxID=40149 RepID=A0A0E0CMM7_9ORYZ
MASSRALLVFALLLAAAFLVNCARQEPQPNEGPAADPNAGGGGGGGDGSSGYDGGKVSKSGHRPQAKYYNGHRPQRKHSGHRPQAKYYGYSECGGGDDHDCGGPCEHRRCEYGCCEGEYGGDRCRRCCDHGEFRGRP